MRGQGQGQPFREQTLKRPRTDMLEAKDQGHKRKCSPKKKVIKIFFQAISKKGLHKLSARFLAFSNKILMIQKIVLSFAEDRAIFED